MFIRILAGAGLALALAAAAPAAHAQASGGSPVASTAADQALVNEFLAAANGDAAARQDFLQRRVAARPLLPAEKFPPLLETIARTSGGLTLDSWTRRGRFVRLTVRAANNRAGRIDLDVAEAEPGKLLGLIAVAMPAPYPGPKPAGPVPKAELVKAIDQRVRFSAARDDFSGVVLVMKGGETIYAQAFGQADKAAGAPNTLETRFNLGSMGKQFTAVAIGQLIEQGRLSLDSRLIDVLPDYPNPEAARKITIRHLLSHQAGLGMLFERPGWDWKLRYERQSELFRLFAAEPLRFEPGSRAAYSNEGFIVLGAVVERLTGQTWYDYVETHVFAPAGMTRTGSLTDDPGVPARAVGYKFGEADPLGFGPRQPNWDTLSWRGNACGGQFSTAGDMIRFLQALKDGRLLKPETVAQLTAATPGALHGFALGFARISTPAGRTIIGHAGGGPASGVNSDAKMVWETGYAYAVLGNYDAPFAQILGGEIGDMLAGQD